MPTRSLVIHGHFYQPPREDPRNGAVDGEIDWNQRISDECYRANAEAAVVNEAGEVVERVNNYAWMSFNFGPTLLAWLERERPALLGQIVAGDRESVARLGHGNAMAQAYSHAILPLCNDRDLKTEIRWGQDDFRERFGREPEGMWLPETACDDRVLEALAAAGLRFVLLAPRQAAQVRALGDANEPWQAIDESTLDTRRAYLWNSPCGERSISIYFYDGAIARAIAFDGLLHDSAALIDRCEGGASAATDEEHVLVHAATDGESYGHHFHFGERCLAYALTHEAPGREFFVGNYGRHLSEHPPTHEARLVDGGSSWSCDHGIERWTRDCGCVTGEEPGDDQAWREPLRAALDGLRDEAAQHAELVGRRWRVDVWALRDADLLHRRDDSVRVAWIHAALAHVVEAERPVALAELEAVLRMQRSALAMYTSCGWFFSDIAGIEARILLRHASLVCDSLAALRGDASATDEFCRALAETRSHRAGFATGEDVYRAVSSRREPVLE